MQNYQILSTFVCIWVKPATTPEIMSLHSTSPVLSGWAPDLLAKNCPDWGSYVYVRGLGGGALCSYVGYFPIYHSIIMKAKDNKTDMEFLF